MAIDHAPSASEYLCPILGAERSISTTQAWAIMDSPEFVFSPVHVTRVFRGEDGSDYEEALTPACDFCLDTRIVWEYPCEQFIIDEIDFGSDGEWAACEQCSELIEKRLLPLLTLRTVRSSIARGENVDHTDIDNYGRIQQGFFDHVTGSRRPCS